MTAIAIALDGLSSEHRDYIAAGGRGFLLGDGGLRYGPEVLTEWYYLVTLVTGVYLTPDFVWLVHPGYNRDRGPAVVLSARLSFRY